MDQGLPARTRLSEAVLNQLFRDARTHMSWSADPITDDDLHAIYDLVKMGPTAANTQPLRVVFLRSAEAKEKLRPILAAGNVDKTMAAPATALIGYDLEFYEFASQTFPSRDMRTGFAENAALAEEMAIRNGTLQAGYLIMAARALGFDCGPMSGFNRPAADLAFFAGTRVKSNFLCNIGHGDGKVMFPRNPRLAFDQTCQIL